MPNRAIKVVYGFIGHIPQVVSEVRHVANDEVPKPRLLNRVHWIQRLDKSLSLLRLDVYLTCNETMLTHLTHDCGESAVWRKAAEISHHEESEAASCRAHDECWFTFTRPESLDKLIILSLISLSSRPQDKTRFMDNMSRIHFCPHHRMPNTEE